MRLFISVLLILSFQALFAQKYTDKTIKQSCDCMSKVDSKLDVKTIEEKVSKCVEDAILANFEQLLKENDLDMLDEKASDKLGETIAVKLVSKCPKFLEFVQKFPAEESTAETEGEYEFAEGEITNVTTSDYVTISLKETSGDTRIFYLVEYFMGAEKITDNLNTLKGKKVKIGYVSKKLFNKEVHNFTERKLMVAFEFWN